MQCDDATDSRTHITRKSACAGNNKFGLLKVCEDSDLREQGVVRTPSDLAATFPGGMGRGFSSGPGGSAGGPGTSGGLASASEGSVDSVDAHPLMSSSALSTGQGSMQHHHISGRPRRRRRTWRAPRASRPTTNRRLSCPALALMLKP